MPTTIISLEDIQIRTYLKPGDIGYVTFLHGDLYSKEFGYGVDFESYVAKGLGEFAVNFDSKKERVWVCEYKEQIIGFLSLVNSDGAAQLRYFLILPEFRGIGLGGKLMNLFMEFMQEAGYHTSFLLTTPALETATKLYQKFGYQLEEELPSLVFQEPKTLLKYTIEL
ncbi:GNAT family N-acetyltransferase [Limibacter armeniacum]|uniref:GNAT family N-acetyltransferase n=1 Tax=Limibacter armeniacum TaxID=466084 RepID=UPI002FE524A8